MLAFIIFRDIGYGLPPQIMGVFPSFASAKAHLNAIKERADIVDDFYIEEWHGTERENTSYF